MPSRVQKNNNFLNLFLNNYFNIIMVFVVIICLIGAYFIVIKPKYDETMAAIQSNLEQQQTLFNNQQKKLSTLKTISDLYNKIPSSDLNKFNGVLPDNYVKEQLFGELGEMITQNGFILNSVEISKNDAAAADTTIVQNPKVGVINVKLALSAVNYQGFKNLLKLMENNLRLFDVTAVSFSPGGNSASLTLSTYYYNK
jgi:hypothetical protein